MLCIVQDLLLSLFKDASTSAPSLFPSSSAGDGGGEGRGQMEWSIAGKSRTGAGTAGAVTVDCTGILLILSAVMNSSREGECITAVRQRMLVETVCCVSGVCDVVLECFVLSRLILSYFRRI